MTAMLTAPYAACAVLLLVAAAPKLRDPMPLARALRSAGLPAGRGLARAIAGVEVAVAGIALTVAGAPAAIAVCGLYVGFSAFLIRALRRGGLVASCGCFGRPDTPATRAHLAVTLGGALVAAAVAARPAWGAPPTDPGGWAITVAGAALIAFVAWQVMDVLPTTTAASVRSARTARGATPVAAAPTPTPSMTATATATATAQGA